MIIVEEEKSDIVLKGHNSYRYGLINRWLDGNVSTNTIREVLGLFDYMGVDYPLNKDDKGVSDT